MEFRRVLFRSLARAPALHAGGQRFESVILHDSIHDETRRRPVSHRAGVKQSSLTYWKKLLKRKSTTDANRSSVREVWLCKQRAPGKQTDRLRKATPCHLEQKQIGRATCRERVCPYV